jgi:molecular chaperone Hsp33
MIMADCTRHHKIRAVAKYKSEQFNKPESLDPAFSYCLQDLLGKNATLAVTIDPVKGERYQGIIPIDGSTLSECLTNYFNHSEQLPTRIWLHASEQRVGGLLLQALPADLQTLDERQEYWNHLNQLANTLTSEEQTQLSHRDQLRRLFHEESLRLFTPSDIHFACSCSKARTSNMLAGFGPDEVTAMLSENDPIEVSCQFCHELYLFNQSDIDSLFSKSEPTLH